MGKIVFFSTLALSFFLFFLYLVSKLNIKKIAEEKKSDEKPKSKFLESPDVKVLIIIGSWIVLILVGGFLSMIYLQEKARVYSGYYNPPVAPARTAQRECKTKVKNRAYCCKKQNARIVYNQQNTHPYYVTVTYPNVTSIRRYR